VCRAPSSASCARGCRRANTTAPRTSCRPYEGGVRGTGPPASAASASRKLASHEGLRIRSTQNDHPIGNPWIGEGRAKQYRRHLNARGRVIAAKVLLIAGFYRANPFRAVPRGSVMGPAGDVPREASGSAQTAAARYKSAICRRISLSRGRAPREAAGALSPWTSPRLPPLLGSAPHAKSAFSPVMPGLWGSGRIGRLPFQPVLKVTEADAAPAAASHARRGPSPTRSFSGALNHFLARSKGGARSGVPASRPTATQMDFEESLYHALGSIRGFVRVVACAFGPWSPSLWERC
jgi:hypothetical protein